MAEAETVVLPSFLEASLLREELPEISGLAFAPLVDLWLVLSMLDPPHHRPLAVVFL